MVQCWARTIRRVDLAERELGWQGAKSALEDRRWYAGAAPWTIRYSEHGEVNIWFTFRRLLRQRAYEGDDFCIIRRRAGADGLTDLRGELFRHWDNTSRL